MQIKLSEPISFGKDTIEELTLKPTARDFRDFAMHMAGDGGFLFEPYKLAALGIRMAGHPAPVTDKLSVSDMMEVAQAVQGFLVSSLKTGSTPSP
jgi:hypothetical protein